MPKPRYSPAAALLAAVLLGATALAAQLPAAADRSRTVVDVEFLGEVLIPTGYVFAGTQVGGLSSLTYDRARHVYYTVSDDPAQFNPVRTYTLAIDVSDGRLDAGDVTFQGVTFLRDANGQPFAPFSLDPEGLVLGREGSLFFSSEGNSIVSPPIYPFISRYNLNGGQTASVPVPAKFLQNGLGTFGVRHNLAFESLAVSPDGRYLYAAAEGALAQDGPAADVGQPSLARLIQYSLPHRRPRHEFVYVVDPVFAVPVPPTAFRVNGVVELVPLDNAGTMLAMERSFSVGVGNHVVLYEICLYGATDVSGVADLFDEATGTPVPFTPVSKRLVLDFADLGLATIDNLEGMAFGPRLPDGRRLLMVVSDNNFSAAAVNQFIALAVDLE
jgi:hypothetical protein